MLLDIELVEKACREMIETILICLNHATTGTIYKVGPMPDLQTVRVASGIKITGTNTIKWGFHESSDYDFPGKSWEQYRDGPNKILEAMGWCVERQKSWTADNPQEDPRSVRKQLGGAVEDYHHMEPVLIRKSELYGQNSHSLEYPKDWQGENLWNECPFVVVAVVKIHFLPNTIKRGDPSTVIIKKLSRTLGTQLLSFHLKETVLKEQKRLSVQRLRSCDLLAHELRNTLVKLGFAFSALNAEISFLREQWERQVTKAFPGIPNVKTIVTSLNEILLRGLPHLNGAMHLFELGRTLHQDQLELSCSCSMPTAKEQWFNTRISPQWEQLLTQTNIWHEDRNEICNLTRRLREAIWMGSDKQLIARMEQLPGDLKANWSRLAYINFNKEKIDHLDDVLHLIEHPQFEVPGKRQTKKVLHSLAVLVRTIPELEEKVNRIIHSVRNGSSLDR